jgi:hypothetical protein
MIGPLTKSNEDCGANCCTWGLILGISGVYLIMSFKTLV